MTLGWACFVSRTEGRGVERLTRVDGGRGVGGWSGASFAGADGAVYVSDEVATPRPPSGVSPSS